MLMVEGIHAAYGRIPVLSGVSFSVDEGEAVGILGHNGMGKTTLLRTLIGHLAVTRGRIRFGGQDITREPPHKRARAGMGYVPQGRAIFPSLTVRDNLRMGYVEGGELSEAQTVDAMVAQFPRLELLLERNGGALSGGEQQILALARCLCGRPKLLLLDEPTEGIQPSIVDEILDILVGLHRDHGLAIIVVEQNLDFITRLSERVLTIQKGTITGELAPGALEQATLLGELVGAEA
ncbi:MAG: ABC transporter ATP-binding protein [Candidatus Eiseniibacteriota bacterium]